ncbi:four-carbon acid sugar kinase family protein [Microvirga sp. W0021]|uniref:Four-carbon acid sugar kinase family protein n=1 Tax=Hohaiivirga grylli TaxID=3133970 RepID=A0ABV0BKJ4_9HYPH
MSKIVIIADDLTGANANGSLLAAKGFSAVTCLDMSKWTKEDFNNYDAVCVNTDSRLVPVEQAVKRVSEGLKFLLTCDNPAVVSKRIDSTMRGNVGSEIEEALKVMDESGRYEEPSVAVVVPAFPSSRRVAVGGYLIVNGIPLEKSPIAKDPIRPITTSRYVAIIAEQTDLLIGYISLDTIAQGPAMVTEEIERQRREGVRIVACDAVLDEEITVIAQAVKSVSYPVLAVDPGPFTAAMADARVPVRARHELEDNALVIVGSTTDLIRRQMDELRLARKCAIVKVDGRLLVNLYKRDDTIREAVQKVVAEAGKAEVYGVCTVEQPDDVHSIEDMARENGISLKEASERINKGLSLIAELLLKEKSLRLGGIYSSGGEVTMSVTRQLEASGFSVRDEVLPLAVYGRLIGGKYPNMPMVTKGGFVGDSESIVHCVNYLFAKISTQTRPLEGETK